MAQRVKVKLGKKSSLKLKVTGKKPRLSTDIKIDADDALGFIDRLRRKK